MAQLVLVGTIATGDPKRGVAIISAGGPAKVFGVGQDVGLARLHSVYMNRVLLDRGGTLETLTLARAQPLRALGADAASALKPLWPPPQEARGAITDVIRTVAVTGGRAGKLRGFRVYPGRNPSAFLNSGLKGGDLVTAINGEPLNDPQRSQEIWNVIQTATGVDLTVERGGRRQELGVNLAQLAGGSRLDRAVAPSAMEPVEPPARP
jgi:general secretion pathway protein C